jgi:hypothetical protein
MGKIINMIQTNKKFIYIAIAAVIIIVAVGITIFIANTSNNSGDTQSETKMIITDATTAILVLDAQKIFKTDPTNAKIMLEKARQQYIDLKNDNGVSNVDSMLCLFDDTCAK